MSSLLASFPTSPARSLSLLLPWELAGLCNVRCDPGWGKKGLVSFSVSSSALVVPKVTGDCYLWPGKSMAYWIFFFFLSLPPSLLSFVMPLFTKLVMSPNFFFVSKPHSFIKANMNMVFLKAH